MLREMRFKTINHLVNAKDFVSLQELLDVLKCSAATLRTDLIHLEQQGLLERIWGGARRIPTSNKAIQTITEISTPSIFSSIASIASTLVRNNSFIFISDGFHTRFIAEHLVAKNCTIVTNSISVFESFRQYDQDVLLTGGKLKQDLDILVGPITESNLEKINFDISFIEVKGVGNNDYSLDNLEMVKPLLSVYKRSKQTYFIANKDAFNKQGIISFLPVDGTNLITDAIDVNLNVNLVKNFNDPF